METALKLVPTYWASVSGGKDSLFMLNLILHNLDKYPLNGVVHFELEIDYPFIKNVIDYMESECKKCNIPFVRIKPRRTWEEIYYTLSKYGTIRGFPMRKARWCNSNYKLDARKQLIEYMKSLGKNTIFYIGYCADEFKRFDKRVHTNEIYPLVEMRINEIQILEWAKTVNLFNNYYLTNTRCGCMYCPLASRINFAYLYKYYPDKFAYMIDKMRETERIRERELNRPFSVISSNPKYNSDYLENIIKTKWIHKLNDLEMRCKNVKLTAYNWPCNRG